MTNKYMIYKVQVNHPDGHMENKVKKGISNSNFEDMKKFFNEVQKEVQHMECDVTMLGVDLRGRHDLIYKKTFDKPLEVDYAIYETSFAEYGEQMRNLLYNMKKKRDHHCQMIEVLDKKEDILLHRVETFKNKKWDSKEEEIAEKENVFDKLQEVREERRNHKDEYDKIKSLGERLDLKYVYESFKITNKENKKYKYLDDKMVRTLDMMIEVDYRDEKDRINKIKQYKNKYDKIKIDEKNKKIICYNNCK